MDVLTQMLRAVLMDPADDTVRLAYADALDETGDPDQAVRAEFIRLQMRLARYGFKSAQIDDTLNRQRELLRRYEWEWFDYTGLGSKQVWWDRGFVYHYNVRPEQFFNRCASDFSAHPIESVHLIGRQANLTWAHVAGFTWAPGPDPEEDQYFGRDLTFHAYGDTWHPQSAPHVIPFVLHVLLMEVRTKNVADTDAECDWWLTLAAAAYGKYKAGLRT